jgi:hypothetical protein
MLHLQPDRTTPAERWNQWHGNTQKHRDHDSNKKELRSFDDIQQNNPKPHKKAAETTVQ